MRFALLFFGFAVIGSASLTSAQDISGTTGTRLNHYATKKDINALRLEFARCIASRFPKQAADWLQSLPGTEEEASIIAKIADPACYGTDHILVDGTEISMNSMRVRFLVAQALVERKINTLPTALPQVTDKSWFDSKLAAAKNIHVDTLALNLDDFGECLVKKDWGNSVALLKARVNSSNELTVVNLLVPQMGPCLAMQKLSIDRPMLRAAIASGIYHVALAPSNAVVGN